MSGHTAAVAVDIDLMDVLCVGYSMDGVQSCRSCLAIASSSKRKKRSDYFLSLALSRSSWVFFTFGGGEIFSPPDSRILARAGF